jgi:anti-sigma factor RsiW
MRFRVAEAGPEQVGDATRLGHEITCREFVEFLDDYLSRGLADGARTAFDAHLAACPSCVAYMKTYEATVRAGKAVLASRESSVPADVPEELVRAVLAACRKP